MKAPKNYYNVVDQKKLGLDQIDKNAAAIAELQDLPVLPEATSADEGKVVKVSSTGSYELGTDENTHIVANPDTESTERLDKLTVGNTTYLVNEDVLPTVLKAVRLKINTIHGNDQNVAIKRLRMKNTLNGDYYQYGGSDTCTCSTGDNVSPLIDNATFDEVYVASSKLPFSIDINFEDGIDITQYNEFGMICSPYENASPLSVDILVSADGEHFIEAGSNSNVGFTYQAYVPFYKFGDVDIKIPDYTSADRGKFLGIDNTDHVVWDNVPKELPTVTSADEGKVLTVDSQGNWGATSMASGVDLYVAQLNSAAAPTTLTLLRSKTYLNIQQTIRSGAIAVIWGVTADNPNTICNVFYVCDLGYQSGKTKLFSMSDPNNILVFENDVSDLTKFNKVT